MVLRGGVSQSSNYVPRCVKFIQKLFLSNSSGIAGFCSEISGFPSGISNKVKATTLGYLTCWRPAYSFHIHSQLFFRELFVSCISSGISYPSSGISSIPSGISNRVRATALGYLTCGRPAYSFHIHSQLFFRELFVLCIPSGISYPSSGISPIPTGISNRVRATPLGYLTCWRPAYSFHIHSQLFFRELFVSCISSGISYPS
jgi:hypothetical protein